MPRGNSAKVLTVDKVGELEDTVSPTSQEPELVSATRTLSGENARLPLDLRVISLNGTQQSPLFRDLSPNECRDIFSVGSERSYFPRDLIVREGDLGTGVFLLTSGFAKITQL